MQCGTLWCRAYACLEQNQRVVACKCCFTIFTHGLLPSLLILPWNLGSFCVLTQGQYPTLHWARGNRCLRPGAGISSCVELSHSVEVQFVILEASVFSTASAKQTSVGGTFSSLYQWYPDHTLLSLPLTCPYVPGSVRQLSLLTVLHHCWK